MADQKDIERQRNKRLFGHLKGTLIQRAKEPKLDQKQQEIQQKIKQKLLNEREIKQEELEKVKRDRVIKDYQERLEGIQCTKFEPRIYYILNNV